MIFFLILFRSLTVINRHFNISLPKIFKEAKTIQKVAKTYNSITSTNGIQKIRKKMNVTGTKPKKRGTIFTKSENFWFEKRPKLILKLKLFFFSKKYIFFMLYFSNCTIKA